MRSQYNPIIVFSSDSVNVDMATNSRNYMKAYDSLAASTTPFRRTTGRYRGYEERSFILDYSEENLSIAKEMCLAFNQESYLILDNEGKASVHYIGGGESTDLGSIKVTNSKPQGDYTYVPDVGQYFTFS